MNIDACREILFLLESIPRALAGNANICCSCGFVGTNIREKLFPLTHPRRARRTRFMNDEADASIRDKPNFQVSPLEIEHNKNFKLQGGLPCA
jgi:hypothetical protein